MFEKTIARVEALLKGMVFDCQACGQCVLKQTGLICPMSCPKGLRNGPCGGTLHGECEVYPDKPCVWVRIHERTVSGALTGTRANLIVLEGSPFRDIEDLRRIRLVARGVDCYGAARS